MSKKLVSQKQLHQLILEKRYEEAASMSEALQRETARNATVNKLPSSIQGFLTPEVRARYVGRGYVDVCQDLMKVVFSGDAGGQAVAKMWAGVALAAIKRNGPGDPEMAALQVAEAVVAHYGKRDVGARERLAYGLVELEVRHAEATGKDPAEFARPIRVVGAAEEPEAEVAEAESAEAESAEAAE